MKSRRQDALLGAIGQMGADAIRLKLASPGAIMRATQPGAPTTKVPMKNRPLIKITVVNANGDRSTAVIKGEGVTDDMLNRAYDAINATAGLPPMKLGKKGKAR